MLQKLFLILLKLFNEILINFQLLYLSRFYCFETNCTVRINGSICISCSIFDRCTIIKYSRTVGSIVDSLKRVWVLTTWIHQLQFTRSWILVICIPNRFMFGLSNWCQWGLLTFNNSIRLLILNFCLEFVKLIIDVLVVCESASGGNFRVCVRDRY
jgi:hypothetical protein